MNRRILETSRPAAAWALSLFAILGLLACGGNGEESAGPETEESAAETGAASPADPYANVRGLPEQHYPPAVVEPLTTALATYAEVSDLLSEDRIDGLPARAARLRRALELAADGAGADLGAAASLMDEAARTAGSLERAGDLETARGAFAELNRALLPVVGADPDLAAGWTVYECPMTEGFGRWMQAGDGSEDLENPFMGQEMLVCGGALPWEDAAPAVAPVSAEEAADHARFAHGDTAVDEGDIAYYTCSMHPSVRSQDPGKCPICSMTLIPVTRAEVESGVVIVDAARRQKIGVRIGRVERRSVPVTIRAVGDVVVDETRLADVSVKYRGWIGRLEVDETGQAVRRGQTLFTLYSPELYAAQEEYLAALGSQRTARGTGAPDRADYLVNASRKRLRLWDLTEAQIDRLAESGEPIEYIPIVSPASGYVVEKNVVAGASVEPGMQLYRIAGLDRVWVEAEVYESELPLVEEGQSATVTFPHLPAETFRGKVTFVMPFLDGSTRTGRVRIELANPGLMLKPDMYANVLLERTAEPALVVPDDAVLYAGEREFVFVDLGEGRLQPRRVVTGRDLGDAVEIVSGLEEGEEIVTSGNFLIAAESRLKLAMEHWGEEGAQPSVRPVDPHRNH
jgi:Cu(I)/Ag(I) efflux system membrane fusion protein